MFEVYMNLPSTPVVSVSTTSGRGQTPEEVAERCVNKLISVSASAPPEIREQAITYRNAMYNLILAYMKEAVTNDRVTVYSKLTEAGQKELAEIIRKI